MAGVSDEAVAAELIELSSALAAVEVHVGKELHAAIKASSAWATRTDTADDAAARPPKIPASIAELRAARTPAPAPVSPRTVAAENSASTRRAEAALAAAVAAHEAERRQWEADKARLQAEHKRVKGEFKDQLIGMQREILAMRQTRRPPPAGAAPGAPVGTQPPANS